MPLKHDFKFHILHFSDLHLGNTSSEIDSSFPTELHDELDDIHEYILNNEIKPEILVISGDFIDKGNISNYTKPFFYDLIKIFVEKEIPIIPCIGNHDFSREDIKTRKQFQAYNNFLHKFADFSDNLQLSENYEKNQGCFIDIPDKNITFLSINTSHNMHYKEIKREIRGRYYQDFKFQNPPTLPPSIYRPFFAELCEKIPEFKFRNKYMLTHHPLKDLIKIKRTERFILDNNIKIVFAGDFHDYHFKNYSNIIDCTAGSLLVANNQRWDTKNRTLSPQQFNFYTINNNKIELARHKRNIETSEWNCDKETNLRLDYNFLFQVEEWCKLYNSSDILQKIMNDKIKLFTKSYLNGDYIGYIDEENFIYVYVIDNSTIDIPRKSDIIQAHIINQLKNDRNDNIRVLDKNRLMKTQIDEKYIW